jgi:membrane protein implicated in regulation of membrane protease activity
MSAAGLAIFWTLMALFAIVGVAAVVSYRRWLRENRERARWDRAREDHREAHVERVVPAVGGTVVVRDDEVVFAPHSRDDPVRSDRGEEES